MQELSGDTHKRNFSMDCREGGREERRKKYLKPTAFHKGEKVRFEILSTNK